MNVIEMPQREEIRKVFEALDEDDRVRVIVLRAEGEHFSSGGYIKGFLEASPEHVSKLAWNMAAPARCTKPVIAANRGYLPGVVAFSARTLRDDLKLPEIFRSVDLGGDYAYGHGHDRASGGHLPVKAFNRLLSGLGFGENAFFSEEA